MEAKEVKRAMSKRFPNLKSDEEADAWLESAHLTEYDLSGMKKVRFELARKDASISLRLPAALLATLKAQAAKANMPTQRLIRMMIEAQLGKVVTKPKRIVAAKAGTSKAARSGKRAA
jgi:predicted DNA binding CopG/RHH family protein